MSTTDPGEARRRRRAERVRQRVTPGGPVARVLARIAPPAWISPWAAFMLANLAGSLVGQHRGISVIVALVGIPVAMTASWLADRERGANMPTGLALFALIVVGFALGVRGGFAIP